MDDCFKAEGFAAGELPDEPTAQQLLLWARTVATAAEPGHIYRDKEGRKTLFFRCKGAPYFLKLHSGVGWSEIVKNVLQFRLPVTSADNEYRAVLALARAGVATLTVQAFARTGRNPARRQSMIVSSELTGTVKLEDYCAHWATRPPVVRVRYRIIRALAEIARRMHAAGINHRDFYLCHFHLDEPSLDEHQLRLYVIDLHRAQIRHATPRRWRIKDLAGLYFSAMDCGLRKRDLLRFLQHYTEGGLRQAIGRDRSLWLQVERQAHKLYLKANGTPSPSGTDLRD